MDGRQLPTNLPAMVYLMPGNPFRRVEAGVLHAQLRNLIDAAPVTALKVKRPKSDAYAPATYDQMLWLGRVEALVEQVSVFVVDLRTKLAFLESHRAWAVDEIMKVLYRALAQIETELPTGATGSFIPAGNAFDALKGIQSIFALAQTELLIVDPYLDETFLFGFAQFAPPHVRCLLLTNFSTKRLPALKQAIEVWRKQHANERPLNARSVSNAQLHDRAVIVDRKRVWTVGQSFSQLATRAPTSFVEADADTAKLKIRAYYEMWDNAQSL